MSEEKFYEITPAEAEAIGKFTIDSNTGVDPYCGKQIKGNWGIRKHIVDLYAQRPEILAVDFSGKVAKTIAQLNFVPIEEPPE